MNSLEIETLIAQAGPKACAQALRDLLVPHFAPVFGAAKLVEHEVAASGVYGNGNYSGDWAFKKPDLLQRIYDNEQ